MDTKVHHHIMLNLLGQLFLCRTCTPPLADDLENVKCKPRLLVTFCMVLAHSHSENHWKELEKNVSAAHDATKPGDIHMTMTPTTQEIAEGVLVVAVLGTN